MKDVRITAIRKARHEDLMERFENPIENACCIEEGQVFVSVEAEKPDGLCESAWETIRPFVRKLAAGGGRFYGNWMRNPHSAMVSCNDGFRPVSFLIEAI